MPDDNAEFDVFAAEGVTEDEFDVFAPDGVTEEEFDVFAPDAGDWPARGIFQGLANGTHPHREYSRG